MLLPMCDEDAPGIPGIISFILLCNSPSLGSTLLQRLQRMQNCVVRLCCNLRKPHVSVFLSQIKLVATALLYLV